MNEYTFFAKKIIKNGGQLQDRSVGSRYHYYNFYGGSSFPRRRLISTEEADFYRGSWFLRRRLISTEEAAFYGGSWFLRRKLISMEEADFYGGGWFPRRRLISTGEAYFHWGGQFLSRTGLYLYGKQEQLHRESKVLIRSMFVLQCAAVAPVLTVLGRFTGTVLLSWTRLLTGDDWVLCSPERLKIRDIFRCWSTDAAL